MKKSITRTLILALTMVSLLIMGYSCSPSDDYITRAEARRLIEEAIRNAGSTLTEAQIQQLINDAIAQNNNNLEITQWEIVNITVSSEDWQWNDAAAQWEAIYDLPELTDFIYENGALISYVFLGEQGVDEVQKLLPYVDTYYAGNDDNGSPIYFTETISADYQFGNPSSVAFFIKDSSLAMDEGAAQNYNFRIVLIS